MTGVRHRARFVITVLVVAVLAGFSSQGAEATGSAEIGRAIAAQQRHTPALLNIQGIVGSGVGLDAAGDAVVRIFVAAPGLTNLPADLDGVPVEVVVTGRFLALCDKQSRCDRPVPIGISTGHPDITAGTLGARVTDGTNVFALSNNHVYAKSNNANLGDSALQPGPFDGGKNPADKIGELFDFEPINMSGTDNLMDAAIVITSTDDIGTSTPADGYGSLSGDVIACDEGCANLLDLSVQKYGRTTGLTTGNVTEVNVTVDVCFDVRGVVCFASARFVQQVAVAGASFSAGGDSGSVIVTQSDADAVSLLFAGSATRTLGNRMDLVLDRFSVTMDAGNLGMPTPAAVGGIGQVPVITGVADGGSRAVFFSRSVIAATALAVVAISLLAARAMRRG
jgi:hypothetical protein